VIAYAQAVGALHGYDLFYLLQCLGYHLMTCCLDPLLPLGFAFWVPSSFRFLVWWVFWISIESDRFGPGSMAEEFLYISLQPLALCNGRFSNPPDLPSFSSGHSVWRSPEPWDLVTDLRTFVQIHDRYSEFRLEMELCLDRIQPVDTWTAFLGVSVHGFYLQILILRTSAAPPN
jgi:hypothetical protein